jgi:hypothetical protein
MHDGMSQLIDNVRWLIFVNVANGPALSTQRNDAQSNRLSPLLIENPPRHPPPLHMMLMCISIPQWRDWSRKAAAIKLGRWWKLEGETLQGSEWVVGGAAHDGTAEDRLVRGGIVTRGQEDDSFFDAGTAHNGAAEEKIGLQSDHCARQ